MKAAEMKERPTFTLMKQTRDLRMRRRGKHVRLQMLWRTSGAAGEDEVIPCSHYRCG